MNAVVPAAASGGVPDGAACASLANHPRDPSAGADDARGRTPLATTSREHDGMVVGDRADGGWGGEPYGYEED